jgi:hypothetical protein
MQPRSHIMLQVTEQAQYCLQQPLPGRPLQAPKDSTNPARVGCLGSSAAITCMRHLLPVPARGVHAAAAPSAAGHNERASAHTQVGRAMTGPQTAAPAGGWGAVFVDPNKPSAPRVPDGPRVHLYALH